MRKYKNIKITHDGITFDSKAEFSRYNTLKTLEKAGLIKNLTLQPKFDFTLPNIKKKLFTYIADFSYQNELGQTIIEDVKGVKTPVYRLKKKLIEALYGIEIVEITIR
jgi:Protein of unknown function (DUF1064)